MIRCLKEEMMILAAQSAHPVPLFFIFGVMLIAGIAMGMVTVRLTAALGIWGLVLGVLVFLAASGWIALSFGLI